MQRYKSIKKIRNNNKQHQRVSGNQYLAQQTNSRHSSQLHLFVGGFVIPLNLSPNPTPTFNRHEQRGNKENRNPN